MPKVDTEWAVMFDAEGVLNVSREYGLPHRWDTHHADMKACVVALHHPPHHPPHHRCPNILFYGLGYPLMSVVEHRVSHRSGMGRDRMGWGCMNVFADDLVDGVWQVGRWMMGVALARVSPGGVDGAPRPTTLRVGDKYVRVAEVYPFCRHVHARTGHAPPWRGMRVSVARYVFAGTWRCSVLRGPCQKQRWDRAVVLQRVALPAWRVGFCP